MLNNFSFYVSSSLQTRRDYIDFCPDFLRPTPFFSYHFSRELWLCRNKISKRWHIMSSITQLKLVTQCIHLCWNNLLLHNKCRNTNIFTFPFEFQWRNESRFNARHLSIQIPRSKIANIWKVAVSHPVMQRKESKVDTRGEQSMTSERMEWKYLNSPATNQVFVLIKPSRQMCRQVCKMCGALKTRGIIDTQKAPSYRKMFFWQPAVSPLQGGQFKSFSADNKIISLYFDCGHWFWLSQVSPVPVHNKRLSNVFQTSTQHHKDPELGDLTSVPPIIQHYIAQRCAGHQKPTLATVTCQLWRRQRMTGDNLELSQSSNVRNKDGLLYSVCVQTTFER